MSTARGQRIAQLGQLGGEPGLDAQRAAGKFAHPRGLRGSRHPPAGAQWPPAPLLGKAGPQVHIPMPQSRSGACAQARFIFSVYHDAAKRPKQNRTCCGFAWFNVLKPVRESASAHEVRAAAQAAGLRLCHHAPKAGYTANLAQGDFVWFFS